MNLLEILVKIDNEYYFERKNGVFKNNEIGSLFNRTIKEVFPKSIIGEEYIVKGSAGQGNWATIPWIGIFDKKVSTTASAGFDIVYLFTSDGKGVYLSLNQGWTYYKKKYKNESKDSIKKVTNYWQSVLKNINSNFCTNEMKLIRTDEKNCELAKGYEYGDICHKYYNISDISFVEEMLLDLMQMLNVFEELKTRMINFNYKETINYILSLNIDEICEEYNNDDIDDMNLDFILDNIRKVSTPSFGKKDIIEEFAPRNVKRDYINEAKKNSKLGYQGEKIVYEIEKKYVSDNPLLSKHIERVKHVAKDEGDGAGYDIISIRQKEDGEIYNIYIEVKSTSSDKNSPFYITSNELKVSRKYRENYYLYRVSNIKGKKPEYYTIQGPLEEKLELFPVSYSCYVKNFNQNDE
ncbi:MrcB family domain-containing protein [Enterococcus sp. LJL128]